MHRGAHHATCTPRTRAAYIFIRVLVDIVSIYGVSDVKPYFTARATRARACGGIKWGGGCTLARGEVHWGPPAHMMPTSIVKGMCRAFVLTTHKHT